MIIKEAIQRVQSMYSRGVQSDDSRLTPRHIYSALKSARSTLLRQRTNKNQKISQWSYQVLPCVELKKAAPYECSCVPSNGCMVLRSVNKIPAPIISLDDHLIQSVTSLDGSIRFDETTFENNKYSSGNKYTSNKPDYYVRNGYLYITSLKHLKGITLTGLFDDFIEAYQFPSMCASDCPECACKDATEYDIPIDGDLIDPLLKIADDELIIIVKQMNEDNTNNTSDDTAAKTMIHQP